MPKPKQPEFIDRINNPEKYPYIENEDGSVSTHQMAAEVDDKGNWVVFPTIVMLPTGELYKFKTNEEAKLFNMRTGNYLLMNNKQEAIKYAKGGYKEGTPLKTFNPLANKP